MKVNSDPISLTNIAEGAVVERFNLVLQEVLDNIADINTDADAVRKIKVEVKIKPDLDRENYGLAFQVKAELAPFSAVVTGGFLDKNIDGKMVAHEYVRPRQQSLPLGEKVTSIEEKRR